MLILFGTFLTIRRVTAVFFLGISFVMQFFSGIAGLGAQTAQTGGVAVCAHVGASSSDCGSASCPEVEQRI